jgi:hypothetical protein
MEYSAEELELLDVIESGDIQSVPFDNDNIKLIILTLLLNIPY